MFRKTLRDIAIVLSLMVLVLSACTVDNTPPSPTLSSEPNPTGTAPNLPDLIVTAVRVEIQSEDPCNDPFARTGVYIEINNQGEAGAPPFVVEVNGAWQNISAGLAPGGRVGLWYPGYEAETEVIVDVTERVPESDESNNRRIEFLPPPTQAPDCLPTPTPILARQEPLFTLEGHEGKVWSVAFSPDGALLVTGSDDDTMRLWRVAEGTLLRTMQGHPFPVRAVAFSPDGSTLATGSTDKLVRLWRVSDGRLVDTLKGHAGWVTNVIFSPDGRLLATSANDYTVRLWRIPDGRLAQIIDEGMDNITDLVFSPESRAIAWSEANGDVRIRRILDGAWLHIWKPEVGAVEASGTILLQGEPNAATSLAYSPDGSMVIAGYADGSLRAWQTSDGSLLFHVKAHQNVISSMAFSPNGSYFITGSWDQTLRLWELGSERLSFTPLRVLAGHTGPVTSVTFNPRGTLIASSSEDGSVRIWTTAPPIDRD